MTRGPGSNLPAPSVTFASRGRGGGSGGQWLSGLLPWWAWMGLAIAFIVTAGVGVVVAFFESIVNLGGALIGLGAVALVVIGAVVAILGFFLRMAPHADTHARGRHMVREGLLGVVFGLAIMFGGLNVAWGVGSVIVHSAMTGVRARVTLPDAPPALQVQFPNLAGSTSPSPAATPHP